MINDLRPLLKDRGYKKIRQNWYRDDDDLIIVFNIQNSYYDKDDYYINLGIIIKQIAADGEGICLSNCHLQQRIDAKNDKYFFELGVCYLSDGCPAEAIPHLVQAIVINKENLEAQIQLAIAHELVDETDLSIMIYNKLIETNPEFLRAYYNKAAMLMGMGDFEEASKTFFKLIKRNPDYYKAYLGIAMSFDKLEKYPDAIRYYKKFLQFKKFSEDSVFANQRIKELREYLPTKSNFLKLVH